MAVTYRAIERYSARRVSSSTTSIPSSTFDSGNVPALRQTLQVICRAASFYCSRLQSILRRRSGDFSLVGTIRLWLTNLLLMAYITIYLVPYLLLREVTTWTVRWLLTCYYSRDGGIFCVTFDNESDRKEKGAHSSCWSLSVYLVDSSSSSHSGELLQSIDDGAKDQAALRLVRKPEAFGWIHLWQHPESESSSTLRMSSVQELPPVWKHQLVTEDSVHEYVSEVCQRPDGLEMDGTRPPWRVYLIPLAADPALENLSSSNCCLLVRCHRLLRRPLHSVIRRAINKHQWSQPMGPTSSSGLLILRNSKSFDLSQRTIPTGSRRRVHVSWTRPIPTIDFIDRICLLTRTTCRQVVLAAFCQSVNQCYRQSGTAAGTLNVEMTAGSSSNPDYYTLPLGSSALDDGLLVLKTLRRQLDDQNHYRMIPADSIFRSCNDSSSSAVVLPVTMEIVTSSQSLSGIGAQLFQWSWPPTPSVPIRLCLWTGDSTIRLGLIQHHQLLFPVKADDVERRIHQLAAGLGVQNRRPLSPHSSPSSSPHRLTPPPTPRL